jgi:hypothetical protein
MTKIRAKNGSATAELHRRHHAREGVFCTGPGERFRGWQKEPSGLWSRKDHRVLPQNEWPAGTRDLISLQRSAMQLESGYLCLVWIAVAWRQLRLFITTSGRQMKEKPALQPLDQADSRTANPNERFWALPSLFVFYCQIDRIGIKN